MRETPRFTVQLPVTMENGASGQGIISNLGLNGAFVSLPLVAKSYKPVVTLGFPAPNSSRSLEVLGLVVRATDKGLGVRFLDLDSDQRYALWLALVPLWSSQIKECPYCGKTLETHGKMVCPWCQSPLDFQQEAFIERVLAGAQPLEMIGTCPNMLQVFHLIRKVAVSDVPVLITGASGTGKEMVAQAIHQSSTRARCPFVVVNCGAIPRALMESELFGHERGAFTGAFRSVVGKVELAQGGTLFLDEVGELPLEMQVKLLRFLQEFTFERVGGRQRKQVDVRIISATNANLSEMIAAGRFREDLYYRLEVINIELPSLKDRDDDVLILANLFLRRYALKTQKRIKGFTAEAEAALLNHFWPGNVRQLINCISHAVVMADNSWVTPENLALPKGQVKAGTRIGNALGLKEAKAKFEAQLVVQALSRFQGNVQQAAEALNTSRSIIYHLIQKHDLRVKV